MDSGAIKAEAVIATGLTKWFGEGETKTTAVKDVALARQARP
jgi:hypothetical protein